ncbi:MAG: signal peptidase II [Firmicutes bacterium]|nr:signal peptidase II [Bacillota bacterium]
MQGVIIVGLILILDQITKILVRTFMVEGQSIPIIGEFLALRYINNEGVAFSFLSGQRAVVTIIQAIAIIIVAILLIKTGGKRKLYDISLAMILGGGIGNIIDRVLFGKVTDMISFSIFPPIFNVADIGVTLGCGLLLLDIILEYISEKKNES